MTTEAVPLLEGRDLARLYSVSTGLFKPKATVRALDGVSFTLEAGRTLAVVGESGCGKSTLARQIAMLEAPSSGSLRIAGADVAHASAAEKKTLRPAVQMVFQNPFASLNPRKKIGQVLEEPLAIQGTTTRAEREQKASVKDAHARDLRRQIEELRAQLSRYAEALEEDLAQGREKVTGRTREGVGFEKSFAEVSTLLITHLKGKAEVRDLMQDLMTGMVGQPQGNPPRSPGTESRGP